MRSPFNRRSVRRSSGRMRASLDTSATSRLLIDRRKKKSQIKVFVRMRPVNTAETTQSCRTIVKPLDDKVVVFDPQQPKTPSFFKGTAQRDPTARANRDLKFAYDHVFDDTSTNQIVYQQAAQPILEKLLEGVNCSVFAYGATGSGKTHTMVGKGDMAGVISYTVLELYDRLRDVEQDVSWEVNVSYMEIYNEMVLDLLTASPQQQDLAIREDPDVGVTVANLSRHQPQNAADLMQMLEMGNRNRTQHPTDANAESSRSHAVFQIFLTQRPRTAEIATDVLMSKMCLIDLAGSERASATKNCGSRFREGANINRSLLALGNCINALASGKSGAHVPYRDSKLTRILKDSLGGNCHTVMIANISPSSLSYEDTYNTLRYADRAKHIKVDAKRNVFNVEQHVHQYARIVEEKQSEIDSLKAKMVSLTERNRQLERALREKENQVVVSPSIPRELPIASATAPSTPAVGLTPKDATLLAGYCDAATALLKADSDRAVNAAKLEWRERLQRYHDIVQWDRCARIKNTDKTSRMRAQCTAKQEFLDERIRKLTAALNERRSALGQTLASEFSEMPSDVTLKVLVCQLTAESKLWQSLLNNSNSSVQRLEAFTSELLSLAKDCYTRLMANDILTDAMEQRFGRVVGLIEGEKKEVLFHDEQEQNESTINPHRLPDIRLNACQQQDNISDCTAVGNTSQSLFNRSTKKLFAEDNKENRCVVEVTDDAVGLRTLPDSPTPVVHSAFAKFASTARPIAESTEAPARVRLRSPPPPLLLPSSSLVVQTDVEDTVTSPLDETYTIKPDARAAEKPPVPPRTLTVKPKVTAVTVSPVAIDNAASSRVRSPLQQITPNGPDVAFKRPQPLPRKGLQKDQTKHVQRMRPQLTASSSRLTPQQSISHSPSASHLPATSTPKLGGLRKACSSSAFRPFTKL